VPVRLGAVAGGVIRDLLRRIGREKAGAVALPSRVEHVRPHVRTRTFWKAGQAFAGTHGYYDEEPDAPGTVQPTLFD